MVATSGFTTDLEAKLTVPHSGERQGVCECKKVWAIGAERLLESDAVLVNRIAYDLKVPLHTRSSSCPKYRLREALGFHADQPVHAVVAHDPATGDCHVVTIYRSDLGIWDEAFRKRRA